MQVNQYLDPEPFLRRWIGCQRGFDINCGLPPMHSGSCVTCGYIPITETIARLDRVIANVRRYQ